MDSTLKQYLIDEANYLLENFVMIDTETTGLGENDTIVELAAVDAQSREVIFDSLIVPYSPCHPAAAKVHGINMTHATNNGQQPQSALVDLLGLATTKSFTAYNMVFDRRLLLQTAYASGVSRISVAALLSRTENMLCAMELANRYFHDHLQWDYVKSCFKRLSLERCLDIANIEREGEPHSALSDALAATDLLRFMAEGK